MNILLMKTVCPYPFSPLRPYWPGCYYFWTGLIVNWHHGMKICYGNGGKPIEFEEEDEFKNVVKVINANPGKMTLLD